MAPIFTRRACLRLFAAAPATVRPGGAAEACRLVRIRCADGARKRLLVKRLAALTDRQSLPVFEAVAAPHLPEILLAGTRSGIATAEPSAGSLWDPRLNRCLQGTAGLPAEAVLELRWFCEPPPSKAGPGPEQGIFQAAEIGDACRWLEARWFPSLSYRAEVWYPNSQPRPSPREIALYRRLRLC